MKETEPDLKRSEHQEDPYKKVNLYRKVREDANGNIAFFGEAVARI